MEKKETCMSDLTINCPHCNQELEIPEDLLGQTVECPSCSGSIQLPEPEPKVAPRKIVVRKRTTTKSTRSTRARTAPTAAAVPATSSSNVGQAFTGIIGVAVAIGWAWWYFGGGYEQEVDRTMQEINQQAAQEVRRIENEVAADSVRQYEIAKRNGSALDAYSAASLVVAAYLQANDEPNYQKWKKIEEEEKKRYMTSMGL